MLSPYGPVILTPSEVRRIMYLLRENCLEEMELQSGEPRIIAWLESRNTRRPD